MGSTGTVPAASCDIIRGGGAAGVAGGVVAAGATGARRMADFLKRFCGLTSRRSDGSPAASGKLDCSIAALIVTAPCGERLCMGAENWTARSAGSVAMCRVCTRSSASIDRRA